MSELSSKFTRQDIETLIEALGDWEMIGNQEFHFLQMIEDAQLPPEDNEAFEIVQRVKDHYRQKKRQILEHRALRQEQAVFIKAKLMLVRRDMQISDLFEMPVNGEAAPGPATEPSPVASTEAEKPATPTSGEDLAQRLHWAEYFIKDLGVWAHYQKFLEDRAKS
jgi:hypothetical protein